MERRAFALPGSQLQYGPDRPLRVTHIDLQLRTDLDKKTIDGVCTTMVRAVDDGIDRIVLDAVDLEIAGVEAAGKPLEHVVRSENLEVRFGRPLAAGERFEFSIAYRVVEPRRGAYFTAPDRADPKKPRQLWTQSQDSDARYWFPCVDYPDNKQTSSTTVVVRKGLFALANGALLERRDDAETTTFTYRLEAPQPTYLFTLVVGEFTEVAQSGGSVPTYYYVPPGREDDGERAFGKTPAMMRAFNDFIGVDYPFVRYSQIAVADFIFGGMENTTATTQTDRTLHDERAHLDFSSDPLVSHELAHQWFGDLLTTRDWSHAWLNEGFATYFEAVWYEYDLGPDEYAYHVESMVRAYISEDEERYRRPIVFNRFVYPIELFDRHLYQKGGAVLHMLRGVLGKERFQRSIKRYVTDNAGGSVETIDFVRAIEAATGRNLRWFFEQWIERGGHPELELSYRYDGERKSAVVDVRQKQKIDENNPAYRFELNVEFEGHEPVRLAIERESESFAIPLAHEPKRVRLDPGAHVLGKVEYKLPAEMLIEILRVEEDPIARIRAAQALGKINNRKASQTLVAALAADRFWGVGVEIARTLATTGAPWAKDALIEARRHEHPKVRRAIATALGTFPRDPAVATALVEMLGDASYFVVAAALESLGKTRDPRAFEILAEHVLVSSWNETIAAGAARGLAELADPRASAPLIDATGNDRAEELRRAALLALARLYALLDERRPSIVEAIVAALSDESFFIRATAIAAAELLGRGEAIPALRRISDRDGDGRLRRDALEAIERISEAQRAPAEIAKLRTEIAELREELQALRLRTEH